MNTAKQITSISIILGLLGGEAAQGGAFQDALVGYWPFDSYTAESNPADMGLPQAAWDAGEGYFGDLSGNDQKAYGVDLNLNNHKLPFQADVGMFGGAFYSETINDRGHLLVVKHTDAININQEDFTISFWQKSQYRIGNSGTWKSGQGRSIFFAKAPFIPAGDPSIIGLGLQIDPEARLRLQANNSNNRNDALLSTVLTYPAWPPNLAPDSGAWVHRALTGVYDSDTDNFTVRAYENGVAVGSPVTVSNDIINNTGDLSIGGFWRNNGWAWQHHISWNMWDGTPEMAIRKAWMDDFAMFKRAFSAGEAKAARSLGAHADLKFPMSDVIPLLDLHLAGSGNVSIGKLTWSYESGLGGTEGEVQEANGWYTVVINGASGTGVTGSPPPVGTVITVW